MLGFMYAEGESVRKNFGIAKELFGLACDSGNQDGCEAFKELNR